MSLLVGNLFSHCSSILTGTCPRFLCVASKCVSTSHGFESTLKGVDGSLEKFGFGTFTILLGNVRYVEVWMFFNSVYNTDYIDLFLIHDPFSGTERRLATYRALQEAKKSGKIRSVGVSN